MSWAPGQVQGLRGGGRGDSSPRSPRVRLRLGISVLQLGLSEMLLYEGREMNGVLNERLKLWCVEAGWIVSCSGPYRCMVG